MISTLLLAAALASTASAADAPPKISGFDPAAMDLTAKPCVDFYQYACGGWLKKNPIPADQSRWGRFNELAERNKEILRGVLAAAAAAPKDDSSRRIGSLYGACMDEAAAEAAGLKPIAAELDAIKALDSAKDVAPLLGRLHRTGGNAGFGYGSDQD